MRLRLLFLACGLSSLVLSSYVSALGLGEVKLKSTLNQPLKAEVKLLDTRDLTAEQILVALASPADFERNGVDRLFFYTEFQFQVDLEATDGPKVVITSRSPVREPYLNFLIEARWTAGRLLREYTLLMDLPVFDEAGTTQAVQAATTRTNTQSLSTSKTIPDSSAAGESRQTTSGGQPSLSGNEYQVRSNDTLWEIALRARADSSVSVHQTMMALYRANPEAFINGNINRLRRGQVLRVPDATEMKSLNKSEAVSQFVQASGDTDTGAQLNASRRVSSTRTESADVSGRVKLTAPSSGAATSGQGSGANDGAGKALESELAVTLEELDKSKAENTELSSRVKDLEAQIETMERLVEVSNEKLRALEVAAGQANASSASQVEESPSTPQPVSDVAEIASSVAVSSSVAAVATPQPTSPQPVPPKKVVMPAKPEPTLADAAIQNAPWIGLGVLGLAGAGFLAYRRRKQAEEQQEDEQEDVFAMDDSADQYQGVADESGSFDKIDEVSHFNEANKTSAIAETGDVVGEADIYIAYGKLDQAEGMLLNALQKEPDSVDIHMKLLEVYSQQQNGSAFNKHYAAILPLASGALLARASELRQGIPGISEVDLPVSIIGDGQDAESGRFSLDDFSIDEKSTLVTATSKPANFNLNLDDNSNLSAAIADVPAAIGNDTDLVLDELSVASGEDDLSELSLALDNLNASSLSRDLDAEKLLTEEELNFDLDDDLEPSESILEESAEIVVDESESLDVVADDFNLDMNVENVDLAALDREMESLDVGFDDLLEGDGDLVPRDIDLPYEDVRDDTEVLADTTAGADELLPDFDLGDDLSIDDEVSTESELNLLELEDDLDELAKSVDSDDVVDLALHDDIPSKLEIVPESRVAIVDEPVVTGAKEGDEEDLFTQALSDFSGDADDLDLNDFSNDEATLADLSDDDMDAELDFLADADEAATKLDLARAYIDMGDSEGAKDILSEVLGEGNDEQRKEANELLGRIG